MAVHVEYAIGPDEARNIVRQIRSIATQVENNLNEQLGRLADRRHVDSLRRLADRVEHDAGLADEPEGVAPHDDEQPQPLEGGVAHKVTLTDSIAGSDDLNGG